MKKENNNNHISRRDFLKTAGATAAVSTAAIYGCGSKETTQQTTEEEVPADKMTYRTNHNNGDRVSLLGYGCMRWPMLKDEKGNDTDEIDQEAVNQLVDYAMAHGVNYYDTAPFYIRAKSEIATGIALKRHDRKKFFLATKMSNSGQEWQSLDKSIELYHRSFERLQTDYFDYYLLHVLGSIDSMKDRFINNGVLNFLQKEREAGRIRNLGWSFHGDGAAFDYALDSMDIHWDFAQIQYNYVDVKNDDKYNAEYLYNRLVEKKIPAVIMEPLLGGRLSRLNAQMFEILKKQNPNDSPAKWAFRYAGTPENVLTVLSGMTYMEHLQENIRTYSPLVPVTAAENKALDDLVEEMKHSDFIPCTECQYCMPCPYGLNIPATFAHYNRCLTFDMVAKTSHDANYVKARRAFLVGYDRAVPKLRQASHCIECGKCKRKCPNRIDIPKRMREIDAYVEKLKTNAEFEATGIAEKETH